MRLFTRNKPSRILQLKNRNHRAFYDLCRRGFTPAEVRRGLITMNKINIASLANGKNIKVDSVYAACSGKRKNATAQAILAKALNIPTAELFPEDDTNG